MDDDFSFDIFDLDPDELEEDVFTVPDSGTDDLLAGSSFSDLSGAELDPLDSDVFHPGLEDAPFSPSEPAGDHGLHSSLEPHFGGGGRVGREEPAGLLLVARGDVEEARDALLEKGIDAKIPITTSEGEVEIKSS